VAWSHFLKALIANEGRFFFFFFFPKTAFKRDTIRVQWEISCFVHLHLFCGGGSGLGS
jgi:hypothetical protein